MGTIVTRLNLQSKKRCEICHRAVDTGYKIEIDGYNIFICSGLHAEIARQRWQEKKKLGIKPGQPIPPKTNPIEDEALGENIPGEEVNE